MTDPISDFLTRLRNASHARQDQCHVPYSRIKASIAKILHEEGFVSGAEESTDAQGHKSLVVHMKYVDGQPSLRGLKRVSKPGCRYYSPSDKIPRVLNGLGISILSTSRGVLKDQEARRQKVGGELLCNIW